MATAVAEFQSTVSAGFAGASLGIFTTPIEEKAAMATQTPNKPKQDPSVEKVVNQLREAFADAPQMAKTGLENALPELIAQAAEAQASKTQTAGRIGIRQGTVSELTVIAPFAPGGAKRLRTVLRLLNGNFSGGKKVGTLHDMRFVFLDNDTKFLFATAYDGEWDPYIDDFATKIPTRWTSSSRLSKVAGIRSPAVKDWIVRHQIPAEGWYVAIRSDRYGDSTDEERRQGRGRAPRQGWIAPRANRSRGSGRMDGTPQRMQTWTPSRNPSARIVRRAHRRSTCTRSRRPSSEPRPAPYVGTHVLIRVDEPQAVASSSAPDAAHRLRRRLVDCGQCVAVGRDQLLGPFSARRSPESLPSFPVAFREGMAARAEQLRDGGVNHPTNWERRSARDKSTSV
jgi:hypothetical protein